MIPSKMSCARYLGYACTCYDKMKSGVGECHHGLRHHEICCGGYHNVV